MTCDGDDGEPHNEADLGGSECPAIGALSSTVGCAPVRRLGLSCDEEACRLSIGGGDDDGHIIVSPECDRYVVVDGKTWTVCSTQQMTFECALCYADRTHFCGYDDWRLPTMAELTSLYDPNNKRPIEWCTGDPWSLYVFIRDPFCLSRDGVWSAEGGGYRAFDFGTGEEVWQPVTTLVNIAALLVRP
jgi:hypothetical protein